MMLRVYYSEGQYNASSLNLLFLKLRLICQALSNHRGQPPTAVTNTFFHQKIQNYTAQSSSQFKQGEGREENYLLVNFRAFFCLFYIFTTQGLILTRELALQRQDIPKVSKWKRNAVCKIQLEEA